MGVEQKTPAKKEAQLRVKYENEKLEFQEYLFVYTKLWQLI